MGITPFGGWIFGSKKPLIWRLVSRLVFLWGIRFEMEKTLLHRLIHMSRFVFICIMFTVATLLDLVLVLVIVGDVGTSYQHLADRFILCVLTSLSLLVFRYFKKLPFVAVVGIHFGVCILLFVLYTWVNSFFVEPHPRAYFYIIRTIIIIYPVVAIGCILIDRIEKLFAKRKTINNQNGGK